MLDKVYAVVFVHDENDGRGDHYKHYIIGNVDPFNNANKRPVFTEKKDAEKYRKELLRSSSYKIIELELR